MECVHVCVWLRAILSAPEVAGSVPRLVLRPPSAAQLLQEWLGG